MTIETKYNIGDKLWSLSFSHDSQRVFIEKLPITRIQFDTKNLLKILYEFEKDNKYIYMP